MKTRILFLDDEPLALQGLQRMLRSMRDAWEMVFVESGTRALEVMAQASFNLVVTDMLMPGMNGAQFLNEVRQRYPRTARLILSGHADKDLILQCAGAAHQCLSKPCQPEKLKEVLARVAQLVVSLRGHELIAETLTQIDRVPSLPSLYIELVETLLNAEASWEHAGAIAMKDPGITAAALKWVNSPFFGVTSDDSHTTKAISCLGLETFRALIFNVNAFTQFESSRFQELNLASWSQQNLNVAIAAKRIAAAENAGEKICQAAYTAGLLHDIGGLIVARHFPEKYVAVLDLAKKTGLELGPAQAQVLGVSHAIAGAYLLGLWGLPPAIVDAVARQDSPDCESAHSFSCVTAVHVAKALVATREGFHRGIPARAIDSNYLARLGMQDRLSTWRQTASAAASDSA